MKHKTLYAGFGCSLLAVIVLRVCQLAFTIESNTGFYKLQYENFWLISAAVILCSVLSVVLFSFTDVDAALRIKEGKTSAVLSIVTGVGFLIKAFLSFNQSVGAVSSLLGLFAVISAIVCFINSYNILSGKKESAFVFILAVPFWIMELVFVFLQNNDVASVPGRFYEIITAALCLVFSIYMAKDKAGMLTGISSKMMVAFSLVASLFCLALSVPNVVLFLAGKGDLLHNVSVLDLLYLAYGVYIPTYIFTTFKFKKV